MDCLWFSGVWRRAVGLPDTMAPQPNGTVTPRCLLCHGFTGCPNDWGLCLACPAAYPIGLPGHANAAHPTSSFMAEIEKLLARLPASVDHVVGYSMGGRIALGLLHAAPKRFQAITIIAAHPGLTDDTAIAQRRRADRYWIDLLEREGMASFVAAWEAQPLFATQANVRPDRLAAQRACRLSHCAQGLARCLARLGLAEMPNTWPSLIDYTGRLSWVVGDLDSKFRRIAQTVKERRPATELKILSGIGHNPLIEWVPLRTH